MQTTILNKLNYCLKWFEPQYVEKRLHWQLFDYYVLSCGDLDKYKNIGAHSGQLDYLINSDILLYPKRRENGLHAGNGFGKTDIIARKHLRAILFHLFKFDHSTGKYLNEFDKDYKTLNCSITTDQAKLVMERLEQLISTNPLLSWLIKSVVHHPYPEIRWISGGATEFKTTKRKGEAIEGKEYGYISVDDCALEQHLEFIRESVLFPRMRKFSDAQLEFFATPKLKNGYYRVLEDIKRKGGFVRAGAAYENPHIDHGTVDYMKQNWSDLRIAQVIYGEFIDNAQMMFASRIENIVDTSLDLEDVQVGQKYIEGWDLARGRKGDQADQTVGYRIRCGQVNHVVRRWAFQLPWTEAERKNINKELGKIIETSSIEREIRRRHDESKARVLLDSTGVGDTLYGIVQDIAKPVDFRGNKDKLLDHAQTVMDAGLIKIPFIPNLVEQMSTYERDDKNLDTDDIMALVVALSEIRVVDNFIGTLDT